MNDTDPVIQKKLYELLKTLTPEERLERMSRLCQQGAELMITGIKQQYPDATESQIDRYFAERVWGKALADKYLPKQ